ncbi:hypothetical protein ACHQM5_023090 [Ranunculus cassubicifolius]
MEYCEFDNIKREKAKAMMKYRRLRKLANFFRLFEVMLALLMFSWLSTRLPTVLEIFATFLKKLSVLVVSSRFVFLIGNAIIVTLFLKSGQLSASNSSKDEANIYEEFVKNSENRPPKIHSEKEEIVFQDKKTVFQEMSVPRDSPPRTPRNLVRESPPNTPRSVHRDKKIYRRSQSDSVKCEIIENPEKMLRRSGTEISRDLENVAVKVEEDISNEEFQRKIDEFLARHAKFHWDESMAIVVQNQC